jgi:hypothetical protein
MVALRVGARMLGRGLKAGKAGKAGGVLRRGARPVDIIGIIGIIRGIGTLGKAVQKRKGCPGSVVACSVQ